MSLINPENPKLAKITCSVLLEQELLLQEQELTTQLLKGSLTPPSLRSFSPGISPPNPTARSLSMPPNADDFPIPSPSGTSSAAVSVRSAGAAEPPCGVPAGGPRHPRGGTHAGSRSGLGHGPRALRVPAGGPGPCALLLAAMPVASQHPPCSRSRVGTGKSGSSASRCQDTLAFKPELGPISPGAGEHQPHVIHCRR